MGAPYPIRDQNRRRVPIGTVAIERKNEAGTEGRLTKRPILEIILV